MNAEFWIKHLALHPHPEGGWYKEVYRAQEEISINALPNRYNGNRNTATSIYFMLEAGNISHFHRIKSDEIWYFHTGEACMIYLLHPNGDLEAVQLGINVENGEVLQVLMPKNTWFAAKPLGAYTLVGCMVAPGFDFQDFELANEKLLQQYPQHAKIITPLIISK